MMFMVYDTGGGMLAGVCNGEVVQTTLNAGPEGAADFDSCALDTASS